jgi:hypothetical protein
MKWLCSAALASALLAGCGAPPLAPAPQAPPAVNDGCTAGTVSRLYLGRDSAAGEVSDAQWRAFVDDAVTPRFPAGFTVFGAHGHWRDASVQPARTVSEASFMLEIVHDDATATREQVRAIADDYRQRFGQQAVLVVHQPARWCLYSETTPGR